MLYLVAKNMATSRDWGARHLEHYVIVTKYTQLRGLPCGSHIILLSGWETKNKNNKLLDVCARGNYNVSFAGEIMTTLFDPNATRQSVEKIALEGSVIDYGNTYATFRFGFTDPVTRERRRVRTQPLPEDES